MNTVFGSQYDLSINYSFSSTNGLTDFCKAGDYHRYYQLFITRDGMRAPILRVYITLRWIFYFWIFYCNVNKFFDDDETCFSFLLRSYTL